MNEGAAFCPKCGTKVGESEEKTVNQQSTAPRQTDSVNNTAKNTQSKSTQNKNMTTFLVIGGVAAVVLIIAAIGLSNSSTRGTSASDVAAPAVDVAAPAAAPAADEPEEAAESNSNVDTSTGSTANNMGLLSTQYGEYTITVPSSYTLDSSNDGDFLFDDKDNNGILVSILSGSTDIPTGQWISENPDLALDSVCQTYKLETNISNLNSCSTGDFEGVTANIIVDDEPALIAYMSNGSNLLLVWIWGKNDHLEVFKLVDVTR